MRFIETKLKGAYIINTEPHIDDRGFFNRIYCKKEFSTIGFEDDLVQINHSLNLEKFTTRGFHYQLPPHSEVKIVKCISGKMLDIIIDIRKGSKTFLESLSVELSEENMHMLFIPKGFAHGYQALEDNTQILYFHSAYYTPSHDRGLNMHDPLLKITWPHEPKHLSDRDIKHPFLSQSFSGI